MKERKERKKNRLTSSQGDRLDRKDGVTESSGPRKAEFRIGNTLHRAEQESGINRIIVADSDSQRSRGESGRVGEWLSGSVAQWLDRSSG